MHSMNDILYIIIMQLKLYGGPQDVTERVEFIGFSLPASTVSRQIIPIDSGVILVNLYSLTLCIVYAICICFVTIWYYRPSSLAREKIDALISLRQDFELNMGIRITTTTALVVECITRLNICIVWSLNVENSLGILLAIWMPQIHVLVMTAVVTPFVEIYIYCQERSWQRHSQIHLLINYSNSIFMLLYFFFPTVILMFAYPTQIIVIFTSVSAYLFATSIFFASIVKIYNEFKTNASRDGQQNRNLRHMLSEINKRSCCGFKEKIPSKRTILLLVVLFVCPWLISLYLHFLLVFALYPILIGKGSVINTGPLLLISLLPSIILTGGAWLAKRVAFKGKPENTAKGATSDTSNGRVSVQQLLQLLQSKAAPQSHAANHVASNASSIHRTQSWQKITSV